jgi:hypothetical protein
VTQNRRRILTRNEKLINPSASGQVWKEINLVVSEKVETNGGKRESEKARINIVRRKNPAESAPNQKSAREKMTNAERRNGMERARKRATQKRRMKLLSTMKTKARGNTIIERMTSHAMALKLARKSKSPKMHQQKRH